MKESSINGLTEKSETHKRFRRDEKSSQVFSDNQSAFNHSDLKVLDPAQAMVKRCRVRGQERIFGNFLDGFQVDG